MVNTSMKRFIAIYLLLLILFTSFSFVLDFKSVDVYAISYKAVSPGKGTKKGQAAIEYAMKYLDPTGYTWGGKTPKPDGGPGVDCSGFVSWVIKKKVDSSITYKNSSEWRSYGRSIGKDMSKAQAGDICCYSGHVALATGNGDQIVHAAQTSTGIGVGTHSGLIDIRRPPALDKGNVTSGGKDSSDEDSAVSEEQRKAAQAALGMSDDQVKMWQAAWDAAKADGWSDAAIAGMFGNLGQECNWNPKSREKGGGAGIGIAGFTSNKDSLQDYCSKNCKHTKVNLNGYNVCGEVSCQFSFLLQDASNKSSYNGNIEQYNKTYEKYKSKIESGYTLKTYKDYNGKDSFNDLKSFKDEKAAAISFHNGYEVSAGWNLQSTRLQNWGSDARWSRVGGQSHGKTDGWYFEHTFNTVKLSNGEANGRPYIASQCMILFGNGSTGNKSDKETATGIATNLMETGYWSEEDLSNYMRLNENKIEGLDEAIRESLGQSDLESVSNWEENVEHMEEEDTVAARMRRLFIMFGIFISVYGVVLYLAFWVDRLNNLIPIRLLDLVTRGKLTASMDDTSTFGNGGKLLEQKVVSHRDIVFISFFTLFVGVLISSGIPFILIYKFIFFIANFLHIL